MVGFELSNIIYVVFYWSRHDTVKYEFITPLSSGDKIFSILLIVITK
jgi:hypothetical protein